MNNKRIVLTGGGTAGHVTPNIALIPFLKAEGWEVMYIGSENGMEKALIEEMGVTYFGISTGKLRRYASKENFKDMFRVVKGIAQASALLWKLKPDMVFSKGGFVAVPVVLGAKTAGIPVIIHESDMTPGLANKIAMPFAKTICTTFPETLEFVPAKKAVHTGTPIRRELFEGVKSNGLALCNFISNRPVLMMMGGSQGSVKLNQCLREALPVLTDHFNIIHLCGKGNVERTLEGRNDYVQFEYVSTELSNLLAAAELVVSRAGSNSISELLALKKPNLLIPLSAKASRGDQILNAESVEKQGFSRVLQEENLTAETLIEEIMALYENRQVYIDTMEKCRTKDGLHAVMQQIRRVMY